MQKHQKIKALFFLGIFSILLIHQAISHWHHQHSEVEHSHNHQHHHEKPEKDNSNKGFFDWYIEMHVHTNATTDVLVLKESIEKKTTIEKKLVKTVLPETVYLAILGRYTSNDKWYQPPDKLQNTYFPNCSLRGPPRLG